MKILFVDDEKNIRIAIQDLLSRRGFEVRTASSGEEALGLFERETFQVLITDLRMSGMSGLELAQRARERRPMLIVFVLTAYGTVENAVQALKDGVYDFLLKPIQTDELVAKLERLAELFDLREEVERFRKRFHGQDRLQQLIGQDPKMLEVFRQIERAAATESSVLITGETGTGKELVARAIHALSGRRGKPFVGVHCASFPESLIESELFGHTKGAFTGAVQERKGRIRSADGGTLFLDELGSIGLNVQAKLLRMLQERIVEPVGSDRGVPVDVRVITACNEDPARCVESGGIRSDFLYRINVLRIHLPPLRFRRGDIPALADHFLRSRSAGRALRISPAVMEFLVMSPWFGNVRELENCVEAMIANCDGDVVLPKHLPQAMAGAFQDRPRIDTSLEGQVEAFEKYLIMDSLRITQGRIGLASKRLAITERTLERKLQKYDLHKESFKGRPGDPKPAETAAGAVPGESIPDSILRHSVDGILVLDRELRVQSINRGFEDLTGWNPGEIVGRKRCAEFLDCEINGGEKISCASGEMYCGTLIKNREAVPSINLRLMTKTGERISVSASITPVHQIPRGIPDQALIVIRKIKT